VVMAYNQEQFVREAVAGAFAQTYSPLEIVLSDDASQDNTFNIMAQMSREYRGPHSIKLNLNARRAGLGGHVDRIMEIARGELIVISAGDDISLPERTEATFRAWDSSGRRATSIYSDYTVITENQPMSGLRAPVACNEGNVICRQSSPLVAFVKALEPKVYGCTHAFVPRLFSFFGPLTESVTYEDLALSFRSHAIGWLLYIRRPLVLYRRHDANLSFHAMERGARDESSFTRLETRQRNMLRGFIRGYDRFADDLKTLTDKNYLTGDGAKAVQNEIDKGKRMLELTLAQMEGSFARRMQGFYRLYRGGRRGKELGDAAARCLPRWLYKGLRIIKNRVFAG
jgi:glycosyltransferase involved in cell wall biosynthesis